MSVNGFVSFQNVMNIYPLPYEPPETFPLSPRPWTAILSPFWADVDVSCPYEEEMLPDHCHVSGVQNDGYAHYKILLSSRVTAREGFDLDDPGLFEDDTLLSRIGVDLTQGTSLINFQPDFALIVTWDGVGYNKHHNDKVTMNLRCCIKTMITSDTGPGDFFSSPCQSCAAYGWCQLFVNGSYQYVPYVI